MCVCVCVCVQTETKKKKKRCKKQGVLIKSEYSNARK